MKKTLFIIAAIATCMTANAKYWFSGSLGFDGTSMYDQDEKNHSFFFKPTVGMEIEDNLSIALAVGLDDNKVFGQKTTEFSFCPFVRWTFFQEGNFSMFLDGGFSYSIFSPSGFNYWSVGAFASPGIRYELSDHFAIATEFWGLYFEHESRPDINPGGTYKNSYGCAADFEDLSFSLIYEF